MLLHASITILAGIIVAIFGFYFHIDSNIFNSGFAEQISILGTITQISISMMGFMLAALAILTSITDKPLIKNMSKMGYFDDLLMSLFAACGVYMFSFLISGSVLIFGDYSFPWRVLLLASLASGVVATFQIGWKFYKVLSNLNIS